MFRWSSQKQLTDIKLSHTVTIIYTERTGQFGITPEISLTALLTSISSVK